MNFLLLYELNNSKEIYPYWQYDKFNFENMDETQCKREFLFLRSHVYDLKIVLKIPEKIVNCQAPVNLKVLLYQTVWLGMFLGLMKEDTMIALCFLNQAC